MRGALILRCPSLRGYHEPSLNYPDTVKKIINSSLIHYLNKGIV